MGQRYDAEKTQVSGQLQEQFDLGMEKMEAGQYDLAKVHFDFIIEHDPKFPGLVEAYADLLIRMQTSPTPTYTATPTVTPTPDLRGVEAIYANLQSALSIRDWDTVLTNLDSLRKADPGYKTAEVDGLYYLALRMRGVDKIILEDGEVCADINLEGGIFDLTQAERFGTLDAVAEGLRGISRLYIIGASYWDQDWEQVQTIFEQVRLGNPYLRDSSCMTATERWRFATIKGHNSSLTQVMYVLPKSNSTWRSALSVTTILSFIPLPQKTRSSAMEMMAEVEAAMKPHQQNKNGIAGQVHRNLWLCISRVVPTSGRFLNYELHKSC